MIARITAVVVEVAGDKRGAGPTDPGGTADYGGWSPGYA